MRATRTSSRDGHHVRALTPDDLITRLLEIEVSALCDADKGLPVVDPAIRAMVPDVRFAGPALTVVARDDHLPLFAALDAAQAGDVLVVVNQGGRRAVVGELFATEARRRGVAGIVVDGLCRDVAGLRRLGLPFFACGTVPASGTTVSRAAIGQRVRCGGVDVAPGDIVFGDDDGLVIASPDRIAAALEGGEAIARAERAILAAMAEGRALQDLTSYAEHAERLDRGEDSALEFRVD
jgi:4-hydroxy-4-methyl-2-oxoglutarate aldolase